MSGGLEGLFGTSVQASFSDKAVAKLDNIIRALFHGNTRRINMMHEIMNECQNTTNLIYQIFDSNIPIPRDMIQSITAPYTTTVEPYSDFVFEMVEELVTGEYKDFLKCANKYAYKHKGEGKTKRYLIYKWAYLSYPVEILVRFITKFYTARKLMDEFRIYGLVPNNTGAELPYAYIIFSEYVKIDFDIPAIGVDIYGSIFNLLNRIAPYMSSTGNIPSCKIITYKYNMIGAEKKERRLKDDLYTLTWIYKLISTGNIKAIDTILNKSIDLRSDLESYDVDRFNARINSEYEKITSSNVPYIRSRYDYLKYCNITDIELCGLELLQIAKVNFNLKLLVESGETIKQPLDWREFI